MCDPPCAGAYESRISNSISRAGNSQGGRTLKSRGNWRHSGITDGILSTNNKEITAGQARRFYHQFGPQVHGGGKGGKKAAN